MLKFLHPKFIPTWILFATMWSASKIPFKIQLFLGKIIGNLLKYLIRSRYKVAEVNLKKCFPLESKKTIRNLLNKHFQSVGISLFETSNCFFMSNRRLKKLHKVMGVKNLQNALDQNKNIILLVGHFTTMVICGRMLILNFKFADIYRPQNNQLFDFVMTKRFGNFGIKMVSVKNPKKMLQVLKSGLPIWYTHDQDLGKKPSIFADFFGVKTATINATAKFAKIANAVVVPLEFYRDKNGYVLKFDQELKDYPSDDKLKNANRTNQILEQQIQNNPEQYGWIHKRFKTRPDGEQSFY